MRNQNSIFGRLQMAFTVLFLTGSFGQAMAQTPSAALDGEASISHKTLASKYERYSQDSNFQISAEKARELVRHMLANGQLNAEEKDLLRELVRTDISSISLYVNDKTMIIPVASPDGRQVFDLVMKPVDLENYSEPTPQNLAQLAAYYDLSVAHKNKIKNFTAGKLLPTWQSSNISNQYEPLRRALGTRHKTSQDHLTPEEHTIVRAMLYDSMKFMDAHLKDTIPDHLYSWLK